MIQDFFPVGEEGLHRPGQDCPGRPQMDFRGVGELEGQSRWAAIHRYLNGEDVVRVPLKADRP